MSNRRYNIKDFLKDEIIPELMEIDELAEQMCRKIDSNDECINLMKYDEIRKVIRKNYGGINE